jgi:hypothetical protein
VHFTLVHVQQQQQQQQQQSAACMSLAVGGHALDCVREAVCFRAPPPQTTSTVHLGILPRPDSLLACPRCRDPWRHESGWTRHRHGSPLRACYMPCRCRRHRRFWTRAAQLAGEGWKPSLVALGPGGRVKRSGGSERSSLEAATPSRTDAGYALSPNLT